MSLAITRKKTTVVKVGSVLIGGDNPITIQSMTNTNTLDIDATCKQISQIVDAGADLVRVSVPSLEAAKCFGEIRRRSAIPVIADIHFDYKIALATAKYGVDCLRINPGNIGKLERIKAIVDCCKHNNIPIRIGVNAGSLEKDLQIKYKEPTAEALVESALHHIDILDKLNFTNFKVSIKASDVQMTVAAYQKLSQQTDNPLHLGITEAGSLRSGSIKSAVGLGILLSMGIGDTIRVSLAADPVEEIKVGFDILKSLKLRSRGVNLIACPSCSRQKFDVIATVNKLEARLADINQSIDVAVIGCVVNGPGEAKAVSVGLTGGEPNLVYLNGKPSHKISNEQIVDELEANIRKQLSVNKL